RASGGWDVVVPAGGHRRLASGETSGTPLRRAGIAWSAIQTPRLAVRRMVHTRQRFRLRHPLLSRASAFVQARTPADAPGRRRLREGVYAHYAARDGTCDRQRLSPAPPPSLSRVVRFVLAPLP